MQANSSTSLEENPKTTVVQVASLDLFWMPELCRALHKVAQVELYSTWNPSRRIDLPAQTRNATLLHYSLAAYKRLPILQRGNFLYDFLCQAFDTWMQKQVRAKAQALYILSGCGHQSILRRQQLHGLAIVESGSTHTNFQHALVTEEFRRNGLRAPLFPEGYRQRLIEEFEQADFIQIPSTFVRETYLAEGISESKLLLAHYGADIARFQVKGPQDRSEKFRVVCSSGVNLRKGARLLVEAWRKLGWRDAELHWVGWPGHPHVRHLFQTPLPGIHWHGWMAHDELAALYRSCDVKVLPSFEEGLARVLIEAAASGLPLIATPNTGVEDFFTPGHPEGWLIEAGSVEALCAALEAAKNDRQRTFELGQRAALRARAGFSWDDYAAQVRENFARVVNKE